MLRASTFGQCVFETPVTRIAPDSEVHFALLLYIASGAPNGVSRDDVVRLLWPQAGIEGGRHCLRQAMYRLRQFSVPVHLRAGYIVIEGDLVACDVRALLHGAPARDEVIRLGALPFLPSYAPSLGEAYAHWVEELRARLATRLRRVLADEVALARSCGRFYDMGRTARALLALDPLNEVATMGLAEALALEGSKVEAIRLLEEYEEEVGTINVHLQIPVRVLRRRVSESLDDSLLLRRFEVPFVGREYEFSELRTLFRDVRQGAALASFVTGEAGIGKSRLSGELLRLAALDGATVATYNTSAGDAFTPISTLVTVGHLLLSLPGALGCAQEHLNYVRRLGTPETVTVWSVTGMAADILYAQLVYALAELVSAIAEEAPLILFVDDAERLHGTTWRVLMDVLERLGDRSVLLLLAARTLPSWFGTLGPHSCDRVARHFRLFPFARQESLQFLHHWSAKNQVTIEEGTRQTCASTSQGNPFYLAELASHLGRGGDPTQTPKSIRELIEIQHAALSKGAQRLLTVIALFESRATTARVRQVLEASASDFMEWLDELEVAGLLGVKGAALGCRHTLVGGISIALAMPTVIAFSRGRIAQLLESEADETNSVELLGDCVTHWELAGERKRAYTASMKLGQRLIGIGMGEDAEKAFVRAERTADDAEERIGSLEGQLIALRLCARWHGVRSAYERRANEKSKIASSPVSIDSFDLLAVESSIWENDPLPRNSEILRLANQSDHDPRTRMSAALIGAMIADNCYDTRALSYAYHLVQDIYIDPSENRDRLMLEIVYHCSVGDVNMVEKLAEEFALLARVSPEYWFKVQGLRRAGIAHLRAGNAARAEELFLDSTKDAERLKLPLQAFANLEHLIDASLALGNLESALTNWEKLVETTPSDPAHYLVLMRDAATTRLAWEMQDALLVKRVEIRAHDPGQIKIATSAHLLLTNQIALQLLLDRGEVSDSSIDTLTQFHTKSRGLGRQDYTADVLFSALTRAGQSPLATQLSRDYCSIHRRERGVVPTRLLTHAK